MAHHSYVVTSAADTTAHGTRCLSTLLDTGVYCEATGCHHSAHCRPVLPRLHFSLRSLGKEAWRVVESTQLGSRIEAPRAPQARAPGAHP
jgi:hypothetical protein